MGSQNKPTDCLTYSFDPVETMAGLGEKNGPIRAEGIHLFFTTDCLTYSFDPEETMAGPCEKKGSIRAEGIHLYFET